MLWALRSHFPTMDHAWFDGCLEVEVPTPTRPTGRVIKLSRRRKEVIDTGRVRAAAREELETAQAPGRSARIESPLRELDRAA